MTRAVQPSAQPLKITGEQALAFRLESQQLARKLPTGSVVQAAAACALQNTPPGAAWLSLHARVDKLLTEDAERATETEKTLLQTWSLRGAPHMFPTREGAIFTQGLLPEDEDELRFFIRGIEQGLARIDLSLNQVVDLTASAVEQVLDGRVLANKRQLDRELAAWVRERLTSKPQNAWDSPSPYGPDQTLGEALVSFALRPVALRGLICFAPRRGNEASFVRLDQWLGEPLPKPERAQAEAELVRRYLHCYGPSTVVHLAEWAGISPAQAERLWQRVEPELVQVELSGCHAWLLESDLPALLSPPPATGVRFLPAHDPYLQLRDRSLLAPDRAVQRRLWRRAGNPGLLLLDGRPAGTWRSTKKGSRLLVTIEPLGRIEPGRRSEIETEVEGVARVKGCNGYHVALA